MENHTETPWKAIGATVWEGDTLYMVTDCRQIELNNREEANEVADANAQFIVKACNAHKLLTEALRQCLSDLKWVESLDITSNFQSSIILAEEALKD